MDLLYRSRVVVVDDEPMAVRAFVKIVDKHCPGFVVVGTAENGADALEVILKTRPDLVVTDISMPRMNGLELAKRAKRELPQLCFVVVSGYQDYVYMREAIQSGVLDYVAKPIVPSSITAMLGRVGETLQRQHFAYRNQLLRSIANGQEVEDSLLEQYFPHPLFYVALLRENGLPRRFSLEKEPELFGMNDEAYCVYGRDSMEQLFLIPSRMLGKQSIESYMTRVGARQKGKESYLTLLYYQHPFAREKLKEKIRLLYHSLNALSAVGVSQTVDLDAPVEVPQPDPKELEELMTQLKDLGARKKYDQRKELIERSFASWAGRALPQVWMENASRRILGLLRFEGGEEGALLESEYLLEEAYYHATSQQALWEELSSLFFSFQEEDAPPKVDSPEFFQGIKEYLEKNLAQSITLQGLCQHFSISQAYMSRLFRKYAQKTYSQYLTELRIETAKQIMGEEEGVFVKDVAQLVGIRDQFYFSRIFKSYVGMSPAEYLKTLGGKS